MHSLYLLIAIALALPHPAQARWQVKSEFQLHLTESLFDSIIADFWQSLQGSQNLPVGNVGFSPAANTHVQINGLNVNVNYSFPQPKRIDPAHREWELSSDKLGARISVDQLLVTQRQIFEKNGMVFETTITVECRNIVLSLPEGAARISARVRAEVAQNQVQLSMPSYNTQWPSGAWAVESLRCPQLANIQGLIKEQIVLLLSNPDKVDRVVNDALNSRFTAWSKEASMLLLSQHELPTKSDHLKVYYEPRTATENNGQGLLLAGVLRFEYPYVSKGQDIEQEFKLPADTQLVPRSSPQLIVPFASIRSMMMGEYFAGNLEYTMRSPELPAFHSLMQSRLAQFFGWPDLMNFEKNTTFLFQIQPMGPPNFDNAQPGAGGAITGDITMPLTVKMFAPLKGLYTPYVEFRSLLSGSSEMLLAKDGKINFKIKATEQPLTYSFAQKYLQLHKPNTKIAVKTLGSAMRDSMKSEGMQLMIPNILVGKQLQLQPLGWELQSDKVLRLNFETGQAKAKP